MIVVYPQDCEDFSTNGLGALTPIKALAYGQDGHFTEIEVTQPVDETSRWALLARGAILKATVPVRESPFYENAENITRGQTVTVTRQIYRVHVNTRLRLRTGPGTSYKILASYKNGTRVVKLGQNGSWYRVALVNGGRQGWMHSDYLTYVSTATETVTQQQVVGTRVVQHSQSGEQLYRVYQVDADTARGTVTAKAQHVFYDLQYNAVNGTYEPNNVTCAAAVNGIWSRLFSSTEHELHVLDGLSRKISGEYSWKNPIECLMDPDEGILSQGGGIIVLDNWEVWIMPDDPRETGVTIRRGKNLKGVKPTSSDTSVVTRIIPAGKQKNGDRLYITNGTGPGGMCVDSSHINEYPQVHNKLIDYDVRIVDKSPDNESTFTNVGSARAKLMSLAQAEYSDNGIDLPEYGLEVDFILLDNADLSTYAGLQSVYLNDTVTVIDELIGLKAAVRVTGFTYNILNGQYEKIELGDVSSVEQTVAGYNLPTGGVSGTKIAYGSMPGSALRSLSVEYAKLTAAAISSLSADAITALTAYIDDLTAETITTNELSASFGHIYRLIVTQATAEAISAGHITADTLMADMAEMVAVSARMGEFNFATIQHLVASAINIQQAAVAGKIFIENLSVAYAQMVDATVSNLVVKSREGNYYRLDVDSTGSVTATQVTVTPAEAAAGATDGGRAILDTDITAANLSTGNLLATYALINKIDAARIDVAELFAQQAFIQHLNATDISSNTTVQIVTRLAEAAGATATEAMELADGAAAEAQELSERLRLWFTFDSDLGLVVQKKDEDGNPVSIWSTVTDDVGYHIRRSDLEEYVFSAYRDRVRIQKLEIGDIIIKPSSKGGHVWTRK